MTVLDTLNFVAFNPLQNNNPIAVRRRKLIAKIDEQIQLAANKDYTPTQQKWVSDEYGNQRKVEVAKHVKRWWTASVDGKINLVVRYGSKPLDFAKGKNAIELDSEAEVAIPKTKIVKQELPQQTTAKDTERTDSTPIRPQPPLPNQQDDRDKR